MTLKLHKKPLTIIRRITGEADFLLRGGKRIFRPHKISFGIGLLAFCFLCPALNASNYSVRQAVYDSSGSSKENLVQVVSFRNSTQSDFSTQTKTSAPAHTLAYSEASRHSAQTSTGAVSSTGKPLTWVPVHSAQGRAIMENRHSAQSDRTETRSFAENSEVSSAVWYSTSKVSDSNSEEESVTLTRIPESRHVDLQVTPTSGKAPRVVRGTSRQKSSVTLIPVAQQNDFSLPPVDQNIPLGGLPDLSLEPETRAVPAPNESFLDNDNMDFAAPLNGGVLDNRGSTASPGAIGGSDAQRMNSDVSNGTTPSVPSSGIPEEFPSTLPRSGWGEMQAPHSTLPPPQRPRAGGNQNLLLDSPNQQNDNSTYRADDMGVYQKRAMVADHCPSPRDMKPIHEITNNIKPPEGQFPTFCPLSSEHDQFPVRQFAGTQFTWTAPNVCHNPLYFEQPDLERYGHSAGPILQPILSGAQFILTIPALPSLVAMNPVNECQYPLGHYRPGSCAPYKWNPLPVSLRSAIAEGGIATGLVFLIP
ncbi:MAG: hypothetical protein Q4C96_05470 [Planctomycetia bacterium]|nr:hypothetical protein [Planctomycetia bacterium]